MTTMRNPVSIDDVLARIHEAARVISGNANDSERERPVSDLTIEALQAIGAFPCRGPTPPWHHFWPTNWRSSCQTTTAPASSCSKSPK